MRVIRIAGIYLVLMFFSAAAFSSAELAGIPLGDSPSTGPENAPVLIVEFIDFQ